MARTLVKEIKDTRKNYIINGDMRISQRGTLFTSITSGSYCLDRYVYGKSGTMVHSIARDTDVPTVAQAGYLLQNSLLSTVTTVDTSIGPTDICHISQRIEGYNWANLAQKPFTLSFWVKSSQTGTYCVAFKNNSTADRSYVAEYTINSANTWEYKTITVAASPSAGTWNYTTGIGLQVSWVLAAGSNFQTTANAWQTGDFFATSNQVNATNTIVTSWQLTGVKINEGSIDSPFSLFGGDIERELKACYRYYETTYRDGDVAGNPGAGAIHARWPTAPSSSDELYCIFYFKAQKRISTGYAVTFYNPVTGVAGQFSRDSGGSIAAIVWAAGQNAKHVAATNSVASDTSVHRIHIVVEAEL